MFRHPEKVLQLRTGERLWDRFRLFSLVIFFPGCCFKVLLFFGFRERPHSEKEQSDKLFGQFRQKIQEILAPNPKSDLLRLFRSILRKHKKAAKNGVGVLIWRTLDVADGLAEN